MQFSQFSAFLEKLEATPSRNEMTAILAELFSRSSPSEIKEICYLSLGRLVPLYEAIEFNLADKMMIRVLSSAYGERLENVAKMFGKSGDIGIVAQNLASHSKKIKPQNTSVSQVFIELFTIAQTTGTGSQERKINLFSSLLQKLDARSAKFVVRIPVGKLRLGFSDVTILDSLSWMVKKDKSLRSDIEKAYNVSSDIGKIAQIFKEKGIDGLKKVDVEVGVPIRTAAAERLPTAQKIIEKLGKPAAEPKYDGFRMQIHLDRSKKAKKLKKQDTLFSSFETDGSRVCIYSRNLENITAMFPDVVEKIQKLNAQNLIIEGEAVGFNPETEEFLPFQETVQRKRKHDIDEAAHRLPLKVFVFDLLALNGKSYIGEPYTKRREALKNLIADSKQNTLLLAQSKIIDNPKDLEIFFLENIGHGLEGIVCKKLDSPYQAGARNYNWVKFKREEKGELEDTIDCVVLGYYHGQGKRADFGIGAFLAGVYDEKEDMFKTIAKIGSGLSDVEWREMKKNCDQLKISHKPARVDVKKGLIPDFWVTPQMVVVIRADEITKSPIHTAGASGDNPGYALRFPRLMGFRKDKSPEDATTVEEIRKMHKDQKVVHIVK